MKLLATMASSIPPSVRAILRDWLPPIFLRAMMGRIYAQTGSAIDLPVTSATLVNLHAEADAALATVSDAIFVIEVDQAESLVGHLFRRRFNTPTFPREPRHFVAFSKLSDGSLLTLGYVHYTMWEGCALCGGLVIDDRHYRRIGEASRKAIRKAGGVAEILLRASFDLLPDDLTAIWGLVGDKQSAKVCLRVGFVRTESDFLMVVWRDARLTDGQKTEWIKRASQLDPF
ncbi:hypothetical protein [Nitrosococcus watsonii]|uniref:Uncharacterized protein n=1 Tax=Nitrosococcus watsoni (strain C-113) TaxID=105559 RepID=D8K6I9_NITWC|nr:hypothetical protein [Nitrosococcus watsonii]ADJ28516.1 conserved hypothetical protein [Nitrosococcus watsonii C-113]